MSAAILLADRFEEHRAHLKTVAYRLLGSLAEAGHQTPPLPTQAR